MSLIPLSPMPVGQTTKWEFWMIVIVFLIVILVSIFGLNSI